MKKLLVVLTICIFVISVPLLAQDFQVFNSSNSDLPFNSVYCIDFDNNGNIWFGGQKDAATGIANVSMLSRDLSDWTVYNQADVGLGNMEDRVFYMAVDDQNTKWFCTHYGAAYMRADGTTGDLEFTRDMYTRSVQTDSKGNIYVSDRDAVGIWFSDDHGANWTKWEMADIGMASGRPEIYDLREDSKGQLWLCTYYGVFYRKMDGTWHAIPEVEGAWTYAMTKDPNDHFWVPINDTQDLYEITEDAVVVHDSTTIEPLKYAVNDIESDFNGHIWCALSGGGLLEILPDGSYNQFTMESTGGKIPQDNLTHMEINNNVIWASTADSGIVRITGLISLGEDMIFTSDNSDLPFNSVYCIDFDNNGNIWFGGQKDAATGIANVSMLSRDLSDWTVYNQADVGLGNMEDRVFYMAVDDQNTKWFCTHYGAAYMRADGTTGDLEFTRDMYTRSVQTDSKGNIYVSDRDAVGIWFSDDHGANWTKWEMADIGMASGRPEIYDLREDSKGQLWLCTYYGVFYRKMDGSWHSISEVESAYTYAMTKDPNDHFWVPINDTQDLYEITEDAVVVHDSTTIEPLKYAVNDIESDFNGHIWCALSGGGLLEILPDGSYNQFTMESTGGKIPQDNLTHMEINNNVIWASTADSGIVRLTDMINLVPTAVTDFSMAQELPEEFTLYANYPNPFNPTTNIRFDLKKGTRIELTVYNIRGEIVNVLSSGFFAAGSHMITWNGRNSYGQVVPSGVYLYRLSAGEQNFTRKMTFIK